MVEQLEQTFFEDVAVHQLLFGEFREGKTPVAGGGRSRSDCRIIHIFSFQRGIELCLGFNREDALFGRFVIVIALEKGVEKQNIGSCGMEYRGDFGAERQCPVYAIELTRDPKSSKPSCSGAYSLDSLRPKVPARQQ
jgi:hypothetical protein